MNLGGYSEIGPREANEDNFFVFDFPEADAFANGIVAYAMVSDGMGGYQGGDVASGLAVACAQSYVTQLCEMAVANRIDLDANAALGEIARNAHEAIRAESASRGNASMGATIVEAFLSPTHAWIAHIGDSRAYLVRDGAATQLTEDHSQVGRLLSRGIITEEEAQVHPSRNRIERALGFSDGDPEIDEVDLLPGDWLVLCSDGVYTVVDSATLASSVSRARDAERAARRVVRLALSKGTDDNSTAAIAWNVEGGAATQRKTDTLAQQIAVSDAVRPARKGRRNDALVRTSSAPRPPWAVATPLLALIVMVGLTVSVFMHAQNDGVSSAGQAPVATQEGTLAPSEGGAASPEASSQPGQQPGGGETSRDGLSSTGAGVTEAQGSGTTMEGEGSSDGRAGGAQGQSPLTQEGATDTGTAGADANGLSEADGYASYTLSSSTELKYIDYDGLAHNFGTDPWNMDVSPWLLESSVVTARTQPEDYGMARSYQQLSDSYVEELRLDLASYIAGATAFDSHVSRLFDQGQYENFLYGLTLGGTDLLESTVAHLAIDAIE